MKRIAFSVLVALLLIFGIEYSNVLGHQNYKPDLRVDLVSNEHVLSWNKLPYPALYRVEILNQLPAGNEKKAVRHTIASYYTWQNHLPIERTFPFQTYGRVSANGLFRHPLSKYSEPVNLTAATETASVEFKKNMPLITSHFSDAEPASTRPMLRWTTVPGAVYYEIEILSSPPENPNGTEASQFRIHMSREVFTTGYNADLSSIKENTLYWRVRALNYDGHPLGVFSDAARLFVDRRLQPTAKPVITAEFNKNGAPIPLYPAYSWIPIFGAISYEVEITDSLPENPNTAEPSKYRIWNKQVTGFACYDEQARNKPGTYYWRVRGLDAAGNAVGVWSKAGKFVVSPPQDTYAATFGDSITHGGGAVSYSPADLEYSYQTYLSFPALNLGKSGDTAETMLERFDSDVLPFKPKFLLIMGGTNSLRGGVPAPEVIRDLTALRNKCLEQGIRPIFLTLPPVNPANIEKVFNEETTPNWRSQFDAVNDFIRLQRYYIDIEPFLSDAEGQLPDYFAIDGLHLDIEGKKRIAQIINLNWIKVTR